MSAYGELVAFWSGASDLMPGDSNGTLDVFVKDLQSGALEAISVASDGTAGNGPSLNAVLSANGQLVAFESRASNLVAGDANRSSDIFVKDRLTGVVERVSMAADGRDGNDGSHRPALSADGRFVAFWSEAGNLVPDDTNQSYANGGYDIFVKDRQSGALERVSVAADGAEGIADSVAPSISADGRFVAFGSFAANLVPGDTNDVPDVFVKDRLTGAVERVSLTADGAQGDGDSFWNPHISGDGRFVAFWSEASNLVPGDTNGVPDVFVKDRQTGALERISLADQGAEGNGASYNPTLSADGRLLAFWSEAGNLVPDDTNGALDVFVRDRQTGAVEHVSLAADGTASDGASYSPTLSADGRLVAFWSEASNLVAGDSNGKLDVFTVDRSAPAGP
ncbi:MAG: PD40 domain-containing protein [Chloroflexi bacterium]|nr:PD40 domain-containing protein [Chloroflexota bacterium]